MARRRHYTNWSRIQYLIESNLRRQAEFAKDVRVEGRIGTRMGGMFHDNYFFVAAGREMILRMARTYRPERSLEQSITSLRREAQTLRVLAGCDFPYPVPELVCLVEDEEGGLIGLIETCVEGAPLPDLRSSAHEQMRIPTIGQVAAAVHALPVDRFEHLDSRADSVSHVRDELAAFPEDLFTTWPMAEAARDWIEAHLTCRPAVLLHGDLLPQNILCDITGDGAIGVIDWECARLGDPAYDLAIVTRGARQPLKEGGGFDRLLALYEEASGSAIPATAVRIHELLLHLAWIAEAMSHQVRGIHEGHGPEQYAQQLASLLRRIGRKVFKK